MGEDEARFARAVLYLLVGICLGVVLALVLAGSLK